MQDCVKFGANVTVSLYLTAPGVKVSSPPGRQFVPLITTLSTWYLKPEGTRDSIPGSDGG
jgi:hypothetical protein